MRLMQTIVAGTGFRDLAHNPTRLNALNQLLGVARREKADLVMLPGGYLTVPERGALPDAIADTAQRATTVRTALALGIDLPDKPQEKAARAPRLPYYAVVCGTTIGGPWKQTSSTREDAADVDDAEVPGAGRVVTVAGHRIGVLICGELFSWWARESFAGLKLDLALDLGHYGMGTGVTRAMENISRNGQCAVAHTHHVAGWSNQSLHFVRAGGVRESVPLSDCEWVGDDEFWIAWYIREV